MPARQQQGCSNTNDEHRQTEQLAHGEQSEEEPELGIRLAKKFDDKAEQSITGDSCAGCHAVHSCVPRDEAHDEKQNNPFKKSSVELRRMPWHPVTAGKNNSPGRIGRSAVQFPVYEIADSP